MHDERLFDVHEARIGRDPVANLRVVWASGAEKGVGGEENTEKRNQSPIRNDEELKRCLRLMKQRGWVDWFAVNMAW